MRTINMYYENYDHLRNFVAANESVLFAPGCDIWVQVFCGMCDQAYIAELTQQIQALVPHAKLSGATTCGEIMDGAVSGVRTVISFSAFAQTQVRTAFLKKVGQSDYELGRQLALALEAEDVKAMILFVTGFTVSPETILAGIRSVNPSLPVAGGSAGDNLRHVQSLVFNGSQISDCGVVGVALNSKTLHVGWHWHLGWKPLGKEMTVTRTEGRRVITIDHIPACQIYKKYLGLEDDGLVCNTIEFPLVLQKNGMLVVRTPQARHSEDDSLEFAADMAEGDVVRLSFGHVDTILSEVEQLLRTVRSQAAESIFIYSCASRRTFLKEMAQMETQPFQHIAPTAGFFTSGEFFWLEDENQFLNGTMTVLVLAEEAADITPEYLAYLPKIQDGTGCLAVDKGARVLQSLTCLVNTVTSELNERTEALEQANAELRYASTHDALTGLYNRRYFEQALKEMAAGCAGSVAIVVCDLDGLKLINDTVGHACGDELLHMASTIFRTVFPVDSVIARIGGDEFSVLLADVTPTDVEGYCRALRREVDGWNEFDSLVPLSISVGYSISEGGAVDHADLFKTADDNMYREKLSHSQSVRSNLLQTLTKTLGERDYITDGHARRLQDLAVSLAIAVGMPRSRQVDMQLFARFHDIGKVGIPEHILFKPAALTPEERQVMQRHSEIGYRIAQSSVDLLPIAEWILKHHEWWDGNGYPLGLSGDTIPVECRILSIVDAYDAMTSKRPYRVAVSREEALAELQRCSGVQFDPALVTIFVEQMKTG